MTQLPEPPFSAAELPGLCDKVTSLDPDLQPIVDDYGYPEFWHRPNTFESFVWFILEQQVSLASARAALEKLRARVGAITPANVLALTDDELRAVYFSRQKITYVRALAREMVNGDLDLASLEKLTDSAIRERLIRLKGIGNWTVDVYLIIVLHRLDLFPVGDLAAVNGLRELKGLPRTTPAEELVNAAQLWSPYRTIGTMLLWHRYLSRKASRHHA
ncbi:MAG: DNA-3-methyladenine glycosylase 2 family protein [Actinomycetota bacterium]|nr:DNA-3-methyladenine glycosylase 2 family protein [Actinomycetota bacterium]